MDDQDDGGDGDLGSGRSIMVWRIRRWRDDTEGLLSHRDEAGLAQLSIRSWLKALGRPETFKQQDTVIEQVGASFSA